jgi:hypothetical protein
VYRLLPERAPRPPSGKKSGSADQTSVAPPWEVVALGVNVSRANLFYHAPPRFAKVFSPCPSVSLWRHARGSPRAPSAPSPWPVPGLPEPSVGPELTKRLIDLAPWPTRARTATGHWLDAISNRRRRHSASDRRSPVDYEERYWDRRAAA